MRALLMTLLWFGGGFLLTGILVDIMKPRGPAIHSAGRSPAMQAHQIAILEAEPASFGQQLRAQRR